jgi:hypothetical protein
MIAEERKEACRAGATGFTLSEQWRVRPGLSRGRPVSVEVSVKGGSSERPVPRCRCEIACAVLS